MTHCVFPYAFLNLSDENILYHKFHKSSPYFALCEGAYVPSPLVDFSTVCCRLYNCRNVVNETLSHGWSTMTLKGTFCHRSYIESSSNVSANVFQVLSWSSTFFDTCHMKILFFFSPLHLSDVVVADINEQNSLHIHCTYKVCQGALLSCDVLINVA